MDFELTDAQASIIDHVGALCGHFDDDYWLERERTSTFPEQFVAAMTEAGWLGVAMPTDFGGAGLGILEASLVMHTLSRSGAGMSGASAIHINIFGPNPIVVFGTKAQKQRFLPKLIKGEDRACFGVTEPNSGLDTSSITTFAKLEGDHYTVKGQKIWTSTAQSANKILLLARTEPVTEGKQPTSGLSLFYTDLDRDKVEVRLIEKMGRHAVDSNELFIDGLKVPLTDLIGKAGEGWSYLLHGLNPERILIGAEAIGLGQSALARASQYAKDRVVFKRPIGQNQAIQHPLAENWMALEAAHLMVLKAASLYDAGQPCGAYANAGKYLAAEAAFAACTQAVMTHGGMGYAQEFHVERLMRESMIPRLAPVSQELIKSFIAEKVLGQPKSY